MKALQDVLIRTLRRERAHDRNSALAVAINANLDPKTAGGVQANLLSLVGQILPAAPGFHFNLFATKNLLPSWRKIVGNQVDLTAWPYPLNWFVPEAEKMTRLSVNARRWYDRSPEDRRSLADNQLRKMAVDLVHFPYQVCFETSLPFVYEPWDLQHEHFPDFFGEEELAWRRDHYQRACSQAALIVTATSWVKNDLVARYGIVPEKIAVIPRDSCNVRTKLPKARRQEILGAFDLPRDFAFYPAMNFPHKNHVRAVQAIGRLRDAHGTVLPLVCCGRILPANWPPIEKALQDLDLAGQVRFLGAVTEEQLSALYGTARLLFFPSLFEGLGYPVVEAFYHGLPVLAAASSCLPEVVGDAGILFDPTDIDSMAGALKTFLESPDLPASMRDAGRRRLRDFDWSVAASAYRACYKWVAERPLSPEENSIVEMVLARP